MLLGGVAGLVGGTLKEGALKIHPCRSSCSLSARSHGSVTDHLRISDTCKPKLQLARVLRVWMPFFDMAILDIVNRRVD